MPTVIETYPDFEEQVRDLVEQHRKLKNGRLHLAVYFAPARREKRDIYLFEVIDGFGGGQIDPDEKLFEFAYGSTPGFPLPDGTSLQMMVTHPEELDEAVNNHWRGLEVVREARKLGRATLIYADAKGKKLWEKIK